MIPLTLFVLPSLKYKAHTCSRCRAGGPVAGAGGGWKAQSPRSTVEESSVVR